LGVVIIVFLAAIDIHIIRIHYPFLTFFLSVGYWAPFSNVFLSMV